MNKVSIAKWKELNDREPAHALVANVDLVIVRYDTQVSVLYGRCLHRGALLADGQVEGKDIICGLHGWDFQYETGISAYNNNERLHKFNAWIEQDQVWVDEEEISAWEQNNPQPFNRQAYLGNYADTHPAEEEPHVGLIQQYAAEGLSKTGHHGLVTAMGVSRTELPSWDEIQFVTAQLSTPPQLDDVSVSTEVVIGPNAKKPLRLKIPLFVSDMSFGALSCRL